MRHVTFSAGAPGLQARDEMLKGQASGFSIKLSATPSMRSHSLMTLAWMKSRTGPGRVVALVYLLLVRKREDTRGGTYIRMLLTP